MTSVWERGEKESAKAWAAFVAYRDLAPADRSIETAYRRLRGNDGQTAVRAKPTNEWWRWSSEHDWKGRALAWDREQDRRHIAALEAAHRQELDRFRDQLRQQCETFSAATRLLLARLLQALQMIGEGEGQTRLTAPQACALLNASIAAIKVANELTAQYLGLEDLLKAVGEMERSEFA